MDPLEFCDPRTVLSRHRYRPSRHHSQNFLTSQEVVDAIAAATVLGTNARVVEIGPGAGTLTAALLRRGATVLALEKDRRMIEVLRAEFESIAALEVREADAGKFDFTSVYEGKYILAGNLPYAITGMIFRRVVEAQAHLEHAVFMIQKEVRDRLLAPPGAKEFGALTVFVTSVFEVEGIRSVPPGAFFPPPKVTSAVIRLRPRMQPLAELTPGFQKLVRMIFDQRRKTLRKALSTLGQAEVIEQFLIEQNLSTEFRGEGLSVPQMDALAKRLTWADR